MLYMILYAALTGVVVVLEHITFGRWWARNELARRTMGHATILFLALLFAPSGLIDPHDPGRHRHSHRYGRGHHGRPVRQRERTPQSAAGRVDAPSGGAVRMRLPDRELHNYEDAIAVSLRIQQRVRRLVYMSDDPDILADLVGIAEDSARFARLS
ncbi:MAG: hypothetical protein IPJ94_28555 [Chloroflexi bacterium]|nr:hypothetical protein [Chloroflexota bacterium]